MRKILMLAVLLLGLAACDKLPQNTTLEGQWQLLTIDNGSSHENVKDSKLFWNLQLGVVEFDVAMPLNEDPYDITGYAHYTYTGDSLLLRDISSQCQYVEGSEDNVRMSQEKIDTVMSCYGINKVDEGFKVNSLSDDYMILNNGAKTLEFIKR